MRQHHYFVYILASDSGTLYIGMTNDLERRMEEHKQWINEGFSKKYGCHKLVYVEQTLDVYAAIAREKQIKKWNREKKISLIREMNPFWDDLSKEWSDW